MFKKKIIKWICIISDFSHPGTSWGMLAGIHVVFMNSCWNSFKLLLILILVFLQEPGGSESSDGSSEDNRRQRVADGPSVSHSLRSAPLPAPPQLRLHLSQLLDEGVSHWHWSGIRALWKAQTLINRGGQGLQISAGRATLSLSFHFKEPGPYSNKHSHRLSVISREKRHPLV